MKPFPEKKCVENRLVKTLRILAIIGMAGLIIYSIYARTPAAGPIGIGVILALWVVDTLFPPKGQEKKFLDDEN